MSHAVRQRLAAVAALALAAACDRGDARQAPDCPDGARGGVCVRFTTELLPPVDAGHDGGAGCDAEADATTTADGDDDAR